MAGDPQAPTPGQATHAAFVEARFPHLDRADKAWQEFTDDQRAAWEAAAGAAAGYWEDVASELRAERDDARAAVREICDRLRDEGYLALLDLVPGWLERAGIDAREVMEEATDGS